MICTQHLSELAHRWTGAAKQMASYGAAQCAEALQKCAAELEEALEQAEEQTLTLTEAAALSGYSADHLGRMVRDGKIPNAGRHGAPRIARGALPRKSGIVAKVIPIRKISRKQIVRSAIGKGAA